MAEKPIEKVEDAPDPDEDDLDDLDDVLDEFQAPSATQSKPAAAPSTASAASGPGRPAPDPSSKDAPTKATEEDLATQLQAGVSSLISELDNNPDMQAEFEKMMQELIAAGAAPSDHEAGEHLKEAAKAAPTGPAGEIKSKPASSASKSASAKKGGDDFQDTIRRTMARMQASDTQATTSTSSANQQSEEDLLAQMMQQLTQGGLGADDEGGFNSMLMSMMAQLTNKEILYDPMKELHDKFPGWLEKNQGTVSKDDLTRYQEQQKLVGEIVERFEKKGYSDDSDEDREYIVDRMQKMQEQGSPPSDLVGDMSAAQEALGDLDSGCPTQ